MFSTFGVTFNIVEHQVLTYTNSKHSHPSLFLRSLEINDRKAAYDVKQKLCVEEFSCDGNL